MKFHYFLRHCYKTAALACFMATGFAAQSQVTLKADGPGNTYQLIESKDFGIESPDCRHTSFGPHVTEIFDNVLGKNVFVFHSHPVDDDDRCTNEDRTRMEIKGGSGSPADMQHTQGQTAYYRWKFKLDAGFIPSGRFTHIFQIKAIEGDAGAPLITITPRAGNPQKMQIIHSTGSGSGGLGTVSEVNLAPFKGTWVEAFVKYKSSEGSAGTFEITLKRLSDGATLLSYTNNSLDMWRTGAAYNRGKWGVYRGKDPVLRSEQVLFNDFCITESSASLCPSDIGQTNQPPAVSLTSPTNGASFAAPANIGLSANAADADGSISKVAFFNGATEVGEVTTSPYNFAWNNVAAGTYTLTAKATDNQGAITTSTAVNITVTGTPSCVPVSASADDGNVPANVLDNNLATRWSASGNGQWIQFCLSTTQNVNGVQIAFYKGDIRISNFDVLTGSDGINWTTAAAGLNSSGTSLALQTFSFAPVSAKYVRIVGHGNNQDLWNSYTEVKINTASSSTTFNPTHDAYVRDGSNAAITHGTTDPTLLITKVSPSGQLNNARESYLTFNIAAAGSTITSAVLKVYGKIDGTSVPSVPVAVYPVATTTWTESAITWNNKPAAGTTALATQTVTNAAFTYYNWDITAYVQSELAAGRTTISVAMKSLQAHDPRIFWNSKEATANPPQLEIGTASAAAANTISVMPDLKSNAPASTATMEYFPNPFKEQCQINIFLKEAGQTRLALFDMQGSMREVLLNGHLPAGKHNATLNGGKVAAGVYSLQLIHNGKVTVKRIIKL